ncbi:MAG: ABC transporter ATP-binding protein [Chloroflexi bacterium]|nr:ABC transporter ATP-binding protein [Chloroflexota bacterium]
MNETILQAHGLSIGYHMRGAKKAVASGLNLSLRGGRLTCLVGPNGSGKSTLLRTLAGLQKPIEGGIQINAEEMNALPPDELARRVSVVLTDHLPPGNLSVRQVVALGRLPYTDWLGTLSAEDWDIVSQSLTQLEASHLAERPFHELSDGERQKTMIARALAQQPQVMILDEPTAFLDWPNRLNALVKLKELAQSTGKAFLLSSHDLELVCQVADELWVMENSGNIAVGTPRELQAQGLLSRVFSTPHGTLNVAL